MSANTKPIFPATLRSDVVEFTDADGTTLKDVASAGAEGSRINAITVTSTDTVARDITIYHNNGVIDSPLARVSIPAGSGTDGTNPAVSILEVDNIPGLRSDLSWLLMIGHKLRAGLPVALSASTKMEIFIQGGDY